MMRQEPLYVWASVFTAVALLGALLSLAFYPRGATLLLQRELHRDHDTLLKHMRRIERLCAAH